MRAEKGRTRRPSSKSVTASDTMKQLVRQRRRREAQTAKHTSTLPPTVRRMRKDRKTPSITLDNIIAGASLETK